MSVDYRLAFRARLRDPSVRGIADLSRVLNDAYVLEVASRDSIGEIDDPMFARGMRYAGPTFRDVGPLRVEGGILSFSVYVPNLDRGLGNETLSSPSRLETILDVLGRATAGSPGDIQGAISCQADPPLPIVRCADGRPRVGRTKGTYLDHPDMDERNLPVHRVPADLVAGPFEGAEFDLDEAELARRVDLVERFSSPSAGP